MGIRGSYGMSYLKYHELSFCIVKHLSELISFYYKASKPDLLGGRCEEYVWWGRIYSLLIQRTRHTWELYPYIKIKVTEICSFMSLEEERWVATGYSYSYGLMLHGSHLGGVMMDEWTRMLQMLRVPEDPMGHFMKFLTSLFFAIRLNSMCEV